MVERTLSFLTREAIAPLVVLCVLAAGVWHYYGLMASLPVLAIVLLLAYVYRDPRREVPSAPLAVVSPVDGRVAAIEAAHDPYLDRDAIKVTIPVHVLGTYVTRSPCEGKILKHWRRDEEPRADAMWIQTDEHDDLVIEAAAGLFNMRLRCYVQSGERIGQGQRCGLVQPGSRVTVYLPATARIEVEPGGEVRAGVAVIGSFVHA